MSIYLWKARTRQGTIKSGELEAANNQAVMSQLRAQLLMPVTVKKKPKDLSEYLPFLKPGIKTRDLVIFTRQFATMIDAGLPLVQCLEILGSQQENSTFRGVIREVKQDVEQGSTFADALGVAYEPLPEPEAGEPDRAQNPAVAAVGAYVPLQEPWQGPNVARALSLVPDQNLMFMSLVMQMYGGQNDFFKLVWEDGPLSRPQVELLAARVSAVSECFY